MLQVSSLNCSYGTVRAVQNATMTVNDNEIIGVVGLNGAGKTTLMKAITGLVPITAGQILLDGTDITKTPTHKRVNLGVSLVLEGRHVFSQMTVLENLKTVSNNKDDIYSMYNIFPDLQRFSHRKAGTLSGGQQQMLAIARALLLRPKLLLLDEPTMGLSPAMTSQVFDAVYNIRRNFSGIVITGQEVGHITAMSDRIYVMKTGILKEHPKGSVKAAIL